VARLSARSGHVRLSTIGVTEEDLPRVVASALQHPLLGNTPDPPDADELFAVLEAAL
jgi:alcohol dehydrogenase class IV